MRRILPSIVAVLLAGVAATGIAQTRDVDAFRKAKAAFDSGDYAAAFPIVKSLAERGNAEAQLILGDMYNSGHGVAQDNAAAVEWYHRSADLGNADAEHMLGQGMRFQR